MQVACPYCRQAVLIQPEQAGQHLACPKCQKTFLAPGNAGGSAVRPSAAAPQVQPSVPPQPNVPPQPVVVEERKGSRPAFRPRQYPMLFGVMVFYYVLAGLSLLSLALWLVMIWSAVGTAASHAGPDQFSAVMGLSTFSAALASLSLIAVHFLWAATCVLVAELIKLMLDIQLNTQETAHNSRYK